MNPLLDFSTLPRFSTITPADVKPAIEQLIVDARATVETIAIDSAPPSWQNFVTPLDDVTERLSRAWGVVGHLNAVVNSPELRDAYNGMLPATTEFWSSLSQDERLFAKYKQIRACSGTFALNAAQNKAIDNELRDFLLGGAELEADRKTRFKAVQEELSTLMSTFNDNVLDATNAFAFFVENESALAGLPGDVKTVAREAAVKDGKAGWKLTLHQPCYGPVMQYADFRPLREHLYRAYVTRASELGADQKWNNSAVITRILQLRAESASLLGYRNYAEVSLATKMAETPAEVIAFIEDMVKKAKPFAERDWRELVDYARGSLNMTAVEAWDVSYVSEKLREQRYAFSDNEVKQYFPEGKVLQGLFRVIETLYGLKVTPSTAETWHKDVRFFNLVDQSGDLVGQFYLDLYARDAKRGGAWMDDAINRRRTHEGAGGVQRPVAFLTCNFAAPVGDKPALFTFDDVITLFHEFGHGLHQLLTEVDELSVSGINGVEWDAVELPSQFMENFCWEWEVLSHMTQHVDSGETLPRKLFDKMIAAKNFQTGMAFVRQLEFSLLDMRLHAGFNAQTDHLLTLMKAIREQVAVVKSPDFNRMAHAFGHIFGGGYAAGYYSYKWAEVLSADAYAAFEESGVLNPETGARFRREVLGRGGSRSALASFTAFRGRKPEMEALLRHNGMKLSA
ncbi:MAG: M3 family metallopeptidase [Burkholderiales bacterium]|nr:M3 family metallopeptidase [Burkholderiales bacterium]